MRKNLLSLSATSLGTLFACGGVGGKVSGRAHFIHGAGTVTPGAASARSLVSPSLSGAVAKAGRWDLSPDQAKVTVSAITLLTADGHNNARAELANCTPTSSRAQGPLRGHGVA